MQAIGLVPWVRRGTSQQLQAETAQGDVVVASHEALTTTQQSAPASSVAPQSQASVQASAQSLGELTAWVSGGLDSAVLLVFDTRDDGTSWPLSKADDALLDGMLRAIGLSKSTVCSCAIGGDPSDSASGDPSQGQSLASLCDAPRQYCLVFGSTLTGNEISEDALEPVSISQSSVDGAPVFTLGGWQLPTLAALRAAPQRKRQAWITLKQLRSSLDQH